MLPASVSRPVRLAAILLLSLQAVMVGLAIPRNAPTIDEPYHLAVGLRYWDFSEFWAYHHNPPLTRLVAAVPLMILQVPRVHSACEFQLHDRAPDEVIRDDFLRLHRRDYMWWLGLARGTGILFALLGGWIVWRWSRELFGEAGGLMSLTLWTFSPWVLAHAGLVTPDVGVTALMIAASYMFWRYLQSPDLERAAASGLLLGLAQAAKFSAVMLVPVWLLLALLRVGSNGTPASAGADGSALSPLPVRQAALHAVAVTITSLATLNSVYLWEGTGERLGAYPLRSPSLTRPVTTVDKLHISIEPERVNRFQDTVVGEIPVPLPWHYVVGFDDQLWDLESRLFDKFLRGELRTGYEPGWWYYYLYGMLVKTPLGTLVLWGLAGLLMLGARNRRDLLSELSLLLPVVVILISLSTKTNLNCHTRYVLPAIPFLHVFAGRIGPWMKWHRWRQGLAVVLLVATAGSVVRVGPHWLAYFNEAAGGPAHGWRHLADSNVDWGQGLIPLKGWLDEHAGDEPVYLSCFAAVEPEQLGIEYEPLDPDDARPGLHVVSATLLAGVPWVVPSGAYCKQVRRPNLFVRYQPLTPVAVPGGSVFVYRVDEETAAELRNGPPYDSRRQETRIPAVGCGQRASQFPPGRRAFRATCAAKQPSRLRRTFLRILLTLRSPTINHRDHLKHFVLHLKPD